MILAEKNHHKIQKCQKRLWETRCELKSYSTLFQSLDNCEIVGSELFGIGLVLQKIYNRIEKIEDQLGEVMIES